MTITADTAAQQGVHLDPARKHDFAFLFDVRDGNPTATPTPGVPRIDPETMQGLVTDVAIKRKIRNTVALLGQGKPGYDIYVEAGSRRGGDVLRSGLDLSDSMFAPCLLGCRVLTR